MTSKLSLKVWTTYYRACQVHESQLIKKFCNRVFTPQGSPSPSAKMTEDEQFVAVVVADIFMIQDSNSHPVFRLDLAASLNNEVGLETIGSGVFPVIGSYFNHSCHPNTVRVNVGKVNYLVTSRTIQAGEEVTDIYSMHFSEIQRERRRSWLQQSFHFLCECQACSQDWKTFDSLGEDSSPLITISSHKI